MRHVLSISAALAAVVTLSACSESADDSVERALQQTVNVVDESDLNDVILNSADPNEAVRYFQRSLGETPDRIDLQRGLAHSLVRAKRFAEGKLAWQRTVAMKGVTNEDRVNLADALIRTNDWAEAKTVLDQVPPTYETFKRYRLEAVVADSNKDWKRADSFYETAVGLTTTPGSIFNNWGYSKLTRGDYSEAERLFGEALRQQPDLFTAKNNLILARGAQRNYTLPVLRMNQTERAQLLYTLALSAVKQGDTNIGEGLLREAVDTHPQHFEAAAQALQALEQG
ncbi:type IV pilus biogenesis/stability protein PilW [Tritonibacter multivorans]|uniref:Type IV pilus biogenesis/stability protein PilW n=1 Tax=Tritonibacter multivorans TaxID=928856 RepID=A0A0P1G1F6_9RHOB|nr:tetratricopeptide repeat protein [Tritonibacter multivorans]MDA7419479.1 tetratricopeptide repeat protein [Tritonibacter multivorans]CUH75546.1 type IV pilus biogenesis/stability protein PilW [Tritonibacter multivorans]SFC65603.1 Tetratricopeptide repeat-containing protein [Tritonibacter multivorans]